MNILQKSLSDDDLQALQQRNEARRQAAVAAMGNHYVCSAHATSKIKHARADAVEVTRRFMRAEIAPEAPTLFG